MTFSEYRSKSLAQLWPKVSRRGYFQQNVCWYRNFSTWQVDDICALNWKNDNPSDVCVDVLFSYIIDDVIGG